MPVRIADIELWSSWPIGRCWRDGLNKWLVGPWFYREHRVSPLVILPRTFRQAAKCGTLQSDSTHSISNKKPTLRRQPNQAVPPHGPIAGCRPLTPKAEHSAIMAEVSSPGCHSRATHSRFVKTLPVQALLLKFLPRPARSDRPPITRKTAGEPQFLQNRALISARNVGWRSGHDQFISPDLLFENAGIGITEALRGCVCRGRVNGIAMRGRRGASAARLRGSEVVAGCALAESIRSVRTR